MKKLLGILVLGLLWCNVGVAETTYIKSLAEELKKWDNYRKDYKSQSIFKSCFDEVTAVKPIQAMFIMDHAECVFFKDEALLIKHKIYYGEVHTIANDRHSDAFRLAKASGQNLVYTREPSAYKAAWERYQRGRNDIYNQSWSRQKQALINEVNKVLSQPSEAEKKEEKKKKEQASSISETVCAQKASKAQNDFAAKKIYEACMKRSQ